MSGVEDVIDPPPDKDEKSEEKGDTIEDKEEDKSCLTTSVTDSDSASVTESWTLLEKEEENAPRAVSPADGEAPITGSSVEDIPDKTQQDNFKSPETDSESIETISDDECLISHPLANSSHPNLASFCYIPDLTDSVFPNSLSSTTSTVSVASDGIQILDKRTQHDEDQPQYEWNSEGERAIPEEDQIEEEEVVSDSEAEQDDIIQQNEERDEQEQEQVSHEESRERSLEPSEPGYDLDDDGLPGAPLAPLIQDVDLYPSQELDPNYPVIQRGEVYKYHKNLQLDHFLTAFVILALALVIGLGIGHFLGLSERLEVQEMFEHLQEEKLDTLQGELVTCIEGEEGQGGDDQDLDDRVIRQLWDENQELRDQVNQMRSSAGDQGDEAMAAILRDRINELLTANADLEREVARLRYADAARGAAESVETLNKLRKTRDTLNDIVTENDQLKIEVAKARYGEPPTQVNTKAERDHLVNENQELKSELEKLKSANNDNKNKESDNMSQKIQNALKYLEDLASANNILPNNLKQDDLNTPWPSRRHEELKMEDEEDKKFEEDHDNDEDDDDNEDDDDIKSKPMYNLSKYLSGLVKIGSKIVTKQGAIDWVQAKKFVSSLKEDLSTKFEEAGTLAKEDIGIIVNKFDDLKNFVNTEQVTKNVKATQTAAGKLVKSLVGAVKNLKEASEDAAEKSDWINKFKSEASKVKTRLENEWYKVKDKWHQVISNENEDHDDDDDDYDDDDDDDDNDNDDDYKKKKSKEQKQKQNKKQRSDDDDDDDFDDDGYHSYDDYKKDRKQYRGKNNYDDDDDGDDKRHSKSKRGRWSKKNRTSGVKDDTNWVMKRGEEREKLRRGEERADWIFERAKHRTDTRYYETRGDWYFERKKHRNSKHKEWNKAEKNHCDKDDYKCENMRKQSSRKNKREQRYNSYDDQSYKREFSRKAKFNQNNKNEEKQRGEKFSEKKRRGNSFKKNNYKYRGETNKWDEEEDKNTNDDNYNYYHFDEEVHYAERHYNDESGKNKHEKRGKRRFSKTENDKNFVIEIDLDQCY